MVWVRVKIWVNHYVIILLTKIELQGFVYASVCMCVSMCVSASVRENFFFFKRIKVFYEILFAIESFNFHSVIADLQESYVSNVVGDVFTEKKLFNFLNI